MCRQSAMSRHSISDRSPKPAKPCNWRVQSSGGQRPVLCNNSGMNAVERTQWIERQARELGFDLCGVTAIPSDGGTNTASGRTVWPELARIPEWLARGNAGELKYLHDPRRTSPDQVM